MRINQHIADVAVLGMTTGAAAACVVVSARWAGDPGDILGFFGGAVGAGLAVIGARWIDRSHQADEMLATRRLLRGSLITLANSALEFRRCEPAKVHASIERFRSRYQAYKNVRSWIQIKDISLEISLVMNEAMIEQVFTEVQQEFVGQGGRRGEALDDLASSVSEKMDFIFAGIETALEKPWLAEG